jgi:hypothetical protein
LQDLAGGSRENVNGPLGRLSASGIITTEPAVITTWQSVSRKPDAYFFIRRWGFASPPERAEHPGSSKGCAAVPLIQPPNMNP